jgi:hypothetical protein
LAEAEWLFAFVDESVVVFAQEEEVVEVGVSAGPPRDHVV